jgi:proteasome lid subunit RPN8/RPN11
MAKVLLSAQARQAICADMLQRPRIEACGLLVGEISASGDWLAQQAIPLRNICNSAVRFEFDSQELLECDLAYGERIVGVYHSHPGGPPSPSGIDTANMENLQESPWVWLIASFGGRRTRGARANEDDLLLAAYRHDVEQGLQTVSIFVVPSRGQGSPPGPSGA